MSYSAGVAFVWKRVGKAPELLLVLQKAGERNEQRTGSMFVERRTWKMPMGHFDAAQDRDTVGTAVREFQEETGFPLSREAVDPARAVSIRIPSERPGSAFHEDHFFLVVAERKPADQGTILDDQVETIGYFPLDRLPTGSEPTAQRAPMAPGHRKKLARLILRAAPHGELGVDTVRLLEAIAAPMRR